MCNSSVHLIKSVRYFAIVLVVLGCVSVALAGDEKKTTTSSAPAKPATAPAKPATGATTHVPTSGGAPTHGATTGGTTTHGPTTSGATHGPTTSGTTHGPTTSRATHGPTTSNPTGAKTTTTGASTRGSTTGTHVGTAKTGAGTSIHGAGTGSTADNRGGGSGRPVPATSKVATAPNGSKVVTRSNGKVSDVHDAKRNMDIHHGLNGNRRVSVERADHSRVVAERGGRGYVERGYRYNGRDFSRRTYYAHGRYYNHYYRGYYYHGYYAPVYAPAYYYGPAYYGWVYNPWPAPIVYSAWGWAAYPWYGYYGPYFAPYPVYAGPAFWLTDYVIAASLAEAYQSQVDAQIAPTALPSGQIVMTPEVKQMISDEVKRQVALENAEAQANAQNQDIDPASSGIARMLSDNQTHVFIAGSDLDVAQVSGQECAISQGDVLEVTSAPPPDAAAATATVLCSKGGKECPKSALVQVAFTDLQEMQNHMRESIDQGMGDLQSKQGKDGLPAAPPSAHAAPVQSTFVASAPPPEQNVAVDIKQETQQAEHAEQEVAREIPPPAPGGGASERASGPGPVTVSQGQTIEEVTAALGQPKSIINVGTKHIWVYPDMKVTFQDGKVSDVQ